VGSTPYRSARLDGVADELVHALGILAQFAGPERVGSHFGTVVDTPVRELDQDGDEREAPGGERVVLFASILG
jgi:hypothetical protein